MPSINPDGSLNLNDINMGLSSLGVQPIEQNPGQLGFARTDTLDPTVLKQLGTGKTPETGGFDTSKLFGNIGKGIGAIGDLASIYTGLKQLGIAREQLDASRSAFDTNLYNQGTLTNARLRDRQTRRVSEDPNAMPVAEYMAQFGVKTERI